MLRNLKILVILGLFIASFIVAFEKSNYMCVSETYSQSSLSSADFSISSQEESSLALILDNFAKANYASPRELSSNASTSNISIQLDKIFAVVLYCPWAIHSFPSGFNFKYYLRTLFHSQIITILQNLRL